jgi:uncharacterized protein (DUF433 family)
MALMTASSPPRIPPGEPGDRVGRVRVRSAVPYLGSVNVERKSRLEEAVWVNPRRVNGVPCFRGTRVPIQSVIDLLEGGETIDDFLRLYPQVARQQVLAVLDFANNQVLECAS